MRSNIMRYAKRLIVALGIAVVVVIAISDVVAYSSSVERASVIKRETLTSPLRPPVPKGEFRLSEYRRLEGHFFQRQPLR